MGTIFVIIAVTVLLTAFTALYVAAEFASVSARRTRVAQLAEGGNGLARQLLPIMGDAHALDTYIAACQLGITASSLVLGYYGQSVIATALAPLLSDLGGLQTLAAESIAATVVLIALTVVQVVFGELVPKSVAIRYPERLALLTVVPMRWSMLLFRPFIAIFNGTGNLILRLLGVPPATHQMHVHSPEEIALLVGESAKGGLLDSDERLLLRNAFRVGDLTAEQVMIPRVRLVMAPITMPLQGLLDLASSTEYSRIPVYGESIDDIKGIVHIKDLYRLHVAGRDDVSSVVRVVPLVPDSKPAVDVWNQLRAERSYVAIVFDEFGGTAGMITVEDLIEEIFGELQDESDDEPSLVSTDPDGRVRLDGEVLVVDVNERFGLRLPSEHVNTMGGLAMEVFGRVPQVGDQADVAGATLRVEAVSGRTVRAVSLVLPPEEQPQGDGEGAAA
jgi:CBS domain containing-hemolysin-like protein